MHCALKKRVWGHLLKKAKHESYLLCLCGKESIKKRFEKALEEIENLFPSEVRKEEDEEMRELGFLSFDKSYSAGGNKITFRIMIAPSRKKFYTKLDEMMKEMKEVPTETLPEEEKKELRIHEEELKSVYERMKEMGKKLHPKEKNLFFAVRYEPVEEEGFLNLETLLEFPDPIKKFLGIAEQIMPEFVPTRSCLRFAYDSKKYKVIGGFTLPTKIPVSQKIIERLGEVDVSGFHLSFKESPLNIDRIEIRLKDDDIHIFTELSSKMHISNKVFQEVYEYGVRASSLFVEAIG